MHFRISDTFTDSLARLTADEQKAVKTAAFDLQLNPAQPGFQFHRVDESKDRRFWSARVNLDLRLIVHRTDAGLLLCYAAHHDDAYEWARRRKLETTPKPAPPNRSNSARPSRNQGPQVRASEHSKTTGQWSNIHRLAHSANRLPGKVSACHHKSDVPWTTHT